MNHPAAPNGGIAASLGQAAGHQAEIGITPLSASGGFIRLWRVYPPLEGLSASGGFIRLWRVYPPLEGLFASGGFIRRRRTWPPKGTCPPKAD